MSSFQPYDPDAAPTGGNDLDPPADGTYNGTTLKDAEAFTAKSGKDFVKFEWETTTGETWTVLQGFKSEAQTAVTWSEVGKLGIDPVQISDLAQLDDALKGAIGGFYDVAVKTNGQFRNTYINGPSTGSNPVVQQSTAVAAASGSPAAPADDDIPF